MSERYWTFRWESYLRYLFFFYYLLLLLLLLSLFVFSFFNYYFIASRRFIASRQSWVFHWIPLCLKYMSVVFFSLSISFLSFNFYIYIFYYYYYYYYYYYVYVSSTCTDLVEKRIRFPQGLSLVCTCIL